MKRRKGDEDNLPWVIHPILQTHRVGCCGKPTLLMRQDVYDRAAILQRVLCEPSPMDLSLLQSWWVHPYWTIPSQPKRDCPSLPCDDQNVEFNRPYHNLDLLLGQLWEMPKDRHRSPHTTPSSKYSETGGKINLMYGGIKCGFCRRRRCVALLGNPGWHPCVR